MNTVGRDATMFAEVQQRLLLDAATFAAGP